MADQDGHAQVLETTSVANPTVFDPQLIHAENLFAITLSPKEIGVTFEGADDVVAVDLRQDPLFFAPDAGAVGPGGLADAGVEEVAPVLAVVVLEGGHVVLDVEEAAGLGAVDDLVQGVGLGGGRHVAVEGDVLGGEVVAVGGVVAVGVVADVLAAFRGGAFDGGEMGFGGGWVWGSGVLEFDGEGGGLEER